MNPGSSTLARLRRWKAGAGRYVVGAAAVAYLSAGLAPCAMAAQDAEAAHEHAAVAHESHGHHGAGAEHHDHAPLPADERGHSCPHCPASTNGDGAIACDDAQVSCLAFEDLTSAAASHAKDSLQPLVPLFGGAAFTLPPPLASPRAPPPLRAAAVPVVPLNVRHCVFLI